MRGGLLGATVIGERAGELIHEWVLNCNGKLSLGDLASVIHVYPTYSKVNQQAAINIQTDMAQIRLMPRAWNRSPLHLFDTGSIHRF